MSRVAVCATGVLVAAISASTSAGVVVVTGENVFDLFAANAGVGTVTETFDAFGGFYNDPLAGSTGVVDWTASATGGLFADSGMMSTNNANVSLSFSFEEGVVQGVGGTMFATDINFNVIPAVIYISLADGTSYAGYITSAEQFVGFFSTDSSIVGMTIQAQSLVGANVFPTVDTLKFAAIPAPGALALLGLAGVAGVRGRRR
ncbi:MAG: hypothetical protein RI967_1999 [Planctomycetota bacterium]|jgi:hypothetical protein